ncbi:MAG: hypothetical protein AAF367_11430 [Pseudomonadota bacterium]
MRLGGLAALPLVALAQPGIWSRLIAGYEGDDFFTLGMAQRIGLAVIALALLAALFVVAAALSRLTVRRARLGLGLGLGVDISIRSVFYGALITLAPQVFYTYYRLIIPGLPSQWVIRWPDGDGLLTGLTFAADGRLAEHLVTAGFWGLIVAAIWLHMPHRPQMRLIATLAVLILPSVLSVIPIGL